MKNMTSEQMYTEVSSPDPAKMEIEEISFSIDMMALKESNPSMYRDILDVFIDNAVGSWGVGIIDVNAIKEAAEDICRVRFDIPKRLDLDVHADAYFRPNAPTEYKNGWYGNEVYGVLCFAYIGDAYMFEEDCLYRDRDQWDRASRVYKYVLAQAGLKINSVNDVERWLSKK